MRKLVVRTYIIMLSAALLFGTSGTSIVSAASPTQKMLPSTAKTPHLTFLATKDVETPCASPDLGYSRDFLKIAEVAEHPSGFITTEIIEEEATEDDLHSLTPTPEPVREVASIEASASATPTIQATVTQAPEAGSSGQLNAEVLFTLVNNVRSSAGLAPFKKHADVCAVVSSRAPELDNEIYGTSYMHAGFKARNLPYWATENMISQQTEQDALNWWMNSPVHRSAIMGDYSYACTACAGKSCAMVFSNLQPK